MSPDWWVQETTLQFFFFFKFFIPALLADLFLWCLWDCEAVWEDTAHLIDTNVMEKRWGQQGITVTNVELIPD